MINVHFIKPRRDWVHGALGCFILYMPPASVKILQNWKLQKSENWICTESSSIRNVPILLSVPVGPSALWWRVIKQVVVISKKWRRFLNVLFSASQRGEAYSTPWNWCLINLPFLMWDVVTWSYFFPSLSVETRGQNTGFQSHIGLVAQERVNTVGVFRQEVVRLLARSIKREKFW